MHRVTFTWDRYQLTANVFRREIRRARVRDPRRYEWTFTVPDSMSIPSLLRSTDIPIYASFLLYCHQQLARSVRENSFNPLVFNALSESKL